MGLLTATFTGRVLALSDLPVLTLRIEPIQGEIPHAESQSNIG